MESNQAGNRPHTPVRQLLEPTYDATSQMKDVQPPQTPGTIQSTQLVVEPPQPPRVRIKRRRPPFAPSEMSSTTLSSADSRVPSIELSEPVMAHAPSQAGVASEAGFLAPSSSSILGQPFTPPRTPLAQITTSFDSSGSGQGSSLSRFGQSISRPSSTFSDMSDSSASSMSSCNTFPSHGESCTSPESDFNDPFTFPETRSKLLPSAIIAPTRMGQQPEEPQHHARVKPKVKWTKEMDDHLWLAYITYLSDPKVTPFKTLPGTAPPLGVCHRVARRAKKTWKGTRAASGTFGNGSIFASLDDTMMRRETSAPPLELPEVTRPDSLTRSLSSGSQRSSWPRSNSTRKRLRELCKKKPSLSPHYQRLMHSRSPPPARDGARQRFSSPPPTSDSSSIFSTRDLNVTLATSTASSMQPGGPLSQLASEPTIADPETPRNRSSAHQKSQSLQSNLGLGSTPENTLRQLASPFHEQPHQPPPPRPHLDPPLELYHPRPLSGSMKRRAQYQLGEELLSEDLDMRRNVLEDLFGGSDVAAGKRRVRSRGFSMGAMRQSSGSGAPTYQLSELFNPPPPPESEQTPTTYSSSGYSSSTMQGITTHPPPRLAPPDLGPPDAVRRLGSPFMPENAHRGFSNTFPRSLFPQGLDSISSLEHQRQTSAGSDASTSTLRHPPS